MRPEADVDKDNKYGCLTETETITINEKNTFLVLKWDNIRKNSRAIEQGSHL